MSTKPKVKMEMRVLSCELTAEEIDAKSAEIARTIMDEKELTEQLERMVLRHKAEKADLDKLVREKTVSADSLALAITTRKVERDVACDWHFNLDAGSAILVRRDTGSAIQRRYMTDHERQLTIGEALESATAEQWAMWEAQLNDSTNNSSDTQEG